MRKIALGVLVLSLGMSWPVFAEETQRKDMPGMECPGMGGKSSMVASDEGGVIVLVGNKLVKYDADLNLLKEVTVPMPAGGKICPMKETSAAGNEKKTA